jgi:hypothetical protein
MHPLSITTVFLGVHKTYRNLGKPTGVCKYVGPGLTLYFIRDIMKINPE